MTRGGYQLAGEGHANRLSRPYSGQSLLLRSGWFENIMLSSTDRDYLSNRVNKCQGASWSEKFDDTELRGALGGERNLELRRWAVSWNIVCPPSITIYYSMVY